MGEESGGLKALLCYYYYHKLRLEGSLRTTHFTQEHLSSVQLPGIFAAASSDHGY